MTALKFSAVLSNATLFVILSLGVGPLGCGGSSSHSDGGAGGRAGSAGNDASASGGASGGSVGGRDGGPGALGGASGSDARPDMAIDFVLVDAAGNNYTCADLLACCNSITNTAQKATCMQGYAAASANGDASCNNLLTQIKAMTTACQ